MRRREFLSLFGSATAAWPLAAAAQPEKVHRMAMFHPTQPVSFLTEHGGSANFRTLFEELRRLGYEEGRNLTVERYTGGGQSATFTQTASQIAASRPDLIFTIGSVITGRFAAAAAGTIPIVAVVNDPISTGLSTSLSRPSANVTGVIVEAGEELIAKRIELLREVHPAIKHLALVMPLYVWAQTGGNADRARQAAQRAGIRLSALGPEDPVQEATFRRAFAEIDRDRPDAILVFEGPETFTFRDLIVELVNAARIPAMYPFREYAEAGGLMAYSIDLPPLYRHAALQVSMILQGRPVAEVPFYQNNRFEFTINRKAAEALGLTIPPFLLASADAVIE